MDRLEELAGSIGNTPLYELQHIPTPQGNRIFAKHEYLNPTGSHYDRIYLALFRALESSEVIHRGETPLIEVSSGCAGASFAWFCHELNYPCTVVVPADLPRSRIQAIERFGAKIALSPAGQYMPGAVRELRKILLQDRQQEKNRPLYCVNHAENPLRNYPETLSLFLCDSPRLTDTGRG